MVIEKMKDEEPEKVRTCDICGFQSTHGEDFYPTITGGIQDVRCYCSHFPWGTYVEPTAFTKRYEKWQRCIGRG